MTGEAPFWEKPLHSLDRAEWEALCDGCGKCCLHKVEDADSGEIYPTNVACRLLDVTTARCSDYRHRRAFVPDCLRLTKGNVDDINWLPSSCAYKLRAAGQPLPEWHYLLTGSYQAMIDGGHSVAGRVVSETEAGPLEHHILEEPL
ncbi:YcgN family cysteine cluster protein [Alterisphingorhabdus coralli]|uniref:YcgN family cysteine cluster protein n=1 Tax=Alterisphingorhabdus coralli TaxID=3071408 RepID=A0AA97I0M4_9SPHN|nr:YcgN family cysteine cluster protein [Parasphingorhabdus sp. SCSIO 66989]WOE75829.1 YcgN family cysteine cluster protein [Parasphingorhabdus sp. SCSIO 66989]